MTNILSGETVYCRFTGEAFTVIDCNGCVATLRDSAGNTTGRIIGEITRAAPLLPMDRACLAYLAEHDGVVPTAGIPARLFVGEIPAAALDLVDLGLIVHVGDDTAITAAGRAALAA